MLIAIGFPIAFVIAWAFELTSERIKRTEDVDVSVPRERRKTRLDLLCRHRHKTFTRVVFLGRYTAATRSSTSKAEQLPAKSIAVLSFENLSDEAQQVIDELMEYQSGDTSPLISSP